MFWKHQGPHARAPRAVRLAWLASFSATVALLAILSLARSAEAMTPIASGSGGGQPFPVSPFDEGPEEEIEVEEVEECEIGEEEECEEESEDELEAPAECLLRTARPTIAVSASQNRVQLMVRYEADSPADVAVSYRSAGGRGSFGLGAQKYRLSGDGMFHNAVALSEVETSKILAARQFTVRLRVLGVPWSCHRYDFKHLTVKRSARGGAVWSEPVADQRADR